MNYITEPQKNIPLRYKADIFVAGGSCTGVFAAVRAARLRVMVNLNQLGEAAGTAAFVSVNENKAVFDLDGTKIRKLLTKGGSAL